LHPSKIKIMLRKLLFLSAACLFILQVQYVDAQSKKEKKEIIIRGNDKGEKMVIVVDGDKVTLNGKEITGDEDKKVMIMKEPLMGGRWRSLFDSSFEMNTEPVAQLGVLTIPNEKGVKGAEVEEVVPESAAFQSGIREKDIIQQVDGLAVEMPEDLVKQIRAKKPGDEVNIQLLRDGKKQTIKVKLGAAPKNTEIRSFRMENLPGFEGMMGDVMKKRGQLPLLREGIREMRPKIGIQLEETENGKGLKVLEVAPDSPAEKAGLKKDDVILHIGDKEVSSIEDVREAITAGEGKIRLDLWRDGKKIELTVTIPKPLKRGRF
jgi:serine protease Do